MICCHSFGFKQLKTPAPSRIPQPVGSVSPRQVRPKTQYLPQMDFANLESKLTQTLQTFDKLNLENFLSVTEAKYNDLLCRMQAMESKLPNLSNCKLMSSSSDVDSLLQELKIFNEEMSKDKSDADKKLLVSKDKQIDLLMSEINDKNKEIEKLRKAALSRGKNTFESELKDTISVLNEKKYEIKCLNEEIIATKSKLHQSENELDKFRILNSELHDELEKLRVINTDLHKELSRMSSVENKMVYTLKELDLVKTENDRLANTLSQKNDIIHELLLGKMSQQPPDESNVSEVNSAPQSDDESDFGPKEVLLLGDSLIKQIIPEHLLPRSCDVTFDKQTVYHLQEIKSLVESSPSTFKNANITVIHCGTNDVKSQTAEACFDTMKSVVDSLQAINPKMKIVLSCIAPRGDEESYDINRQELKLRLLKEYSLDPAVTLCDNNNLANHGKIVNKFYAVDKIHLNKEGSSVLASNISSTLKYVMGIDIKRHYSPKKGNP